MSIMGTDGVDAWFKMMTSHQKLHYFKNDISGVSQWTGKEHKEMEKVFTGLVASRQDPWLMSAVRSTLNFILYSSLQSHTSKTLTMFKTTLDFFHAHKEVFIELGGQEASHFNILKIHAMEHYVNMIWWFGSADSFNTESPKQLHIDYAKDAYRAMNKKDFIIQMTVWLHCQEAIDCGLLFLNGAMNKI
ncbi:hypothetical protein HD554DRAFT_2030982 [Boletus coccyginus]|nr:hypothetical protein HD554DRAFT_2030982 [Boletus coccyginus]